LLLLIRNQPVIAYEEDLLYRLLLKISVAALDSLLFATEGCIISAGFPVVTEAEALISLNG
jgi:hypothetical protein